MDCVRFASECGTCKDAASLSICRSIALQVHQQRKALHKEHEELFDTEVEKLVELNFINQLGAVNRQRYMSAPLLRTRSALQAAPGTTAEGWFQQ